MTATAPTGRCFALTGGIACGKSAVAALWRQWGAEVLDADDVVHELLAPGGACVASVAGEFGPEVVAAGGGIDRLRLGRIVFADAAARQRLEALVHPPVIGRMREWAADVRRRGKIGVAVIPLLFETGLEAEFDATVCVAADDAVVLERLAARGLDAAEARARMASQWPLAEKCARARYTIENNGSPAELETASRALWKTMTEQGD
jgi:dephospho-CoA kinase